MTQDELKKRTKQFALRVINMVAALPINSVGRIAELLSVQRITPLHREACELVAIFAMSSITAKASSC